MKTLPVINEKIFRSKNKEIRNIVWMKTKGKCYLCGCNLLPFGDEPSSFSIDHKFPVTLGGKHDIENLFPACLHCNRMKGTKSYEEFMEWVFVQMSFSSKEIYKTIYRNLYGS